MSYIPLSDLENVEFVQFLRPRNLYYYQTIGSYSIVIGVNDLVLNYDGNLVHMELSSNGRKLKYHV